MLNKKDTFNLTRFVIKYSNINTLLIGEESIYKIVTVRLHSVNIVF